MTVFFRMEKKTVVLMTFGKTRDHEIADLVEIMRSELGLMVFDTRGHNQIDIARSLLATQALRMGSDVVVFIDHDMWFDPSDVLEIAETARKTVGIVSAPYSRRGMGAGIVGGSIVSEADGKVGFFGAGGLHEVSGTVGMGFTAIHHSVFRRLDAVEGYGLMRCAEGEVVPYFQKIVRDGYWLHEDASFCQVAREQGATLHVDTRIRVKHVGNYAFGIEDCLRIPVVEAPELRLRLVPG